MLVDLAFGDPAGVHGGAEGGEAAAALEVHFAAKGIGSGAGGGGVGFVAGYYGVALPTVVQRPAVGDQQAVVVPLIP